jgi:hypothetical protein
MPVVGVHQRVVRFRGQRPIRVEHDQRRNPTTFEGSPVPLTTCHPTPAPPAPRHRSSSARNGPVPMAPPAGPSLRGGASPSNPSTSSHRSSAGPYSRFVPPPRARGSPRQARIPGYGPPRGRPRVAQPIPSTVARSTPPSAAIARWSLPSPSPCLLRKACSGQVLGTGRPWGLVNRPGRPLARGERGIRRRPADPRNDPLVRGVTWVFGTLPTMPPFRVFRVFRGPNGFQNAHPPESVETNWLSPASGNRKAALEGAAKCVQK